METTNRNAEYKTITTAWAYLRVSTKQQTEENQRPDVVAWCQNHACELLKVYTEKESGFKSGRQRQLAKLLEDVRKGPRPDYLVLWDLSRFTRQGIPHFVNLREQFRAYNVKLVFVKQDFLNSEYPFSEVVTMTMAEVAKYESVNKSERVIAGQTRAVKQGKRIGRPPGKKDKHPRDKAGYYERWKK